MRPPSPLLVVPLIVPRVVLLAMLLAMLLSVTAWATAGIGGTPLAAAPQGEAGSSTLLGRMDKGFLCPETMRSDAERMASLRAFFSAYAAANPEATPTDMLAYRHVLLMKHHCAKTLDQIAAAEQAVREGDVERQAWLPIGNHDGIALAMSTDHVAVTLDARFSNEKSVDAYARLEFSGPATTSATHVRYNVIVSHSLYLCQSHRYILEDNTYFLDGKRMLKDEGQIIGRLDDGKPIYAVRDVPNGSFNEEAWHWACEVARGTVS
jgi:hypothetical protein